mmetsp:Transcript_21984/g.54180  ORF Transcript_21984/g.54180 Transcript_21984/m.54180 type:complete len:394 (+) Transcript_21984:1370-2551(+)
MEADLAEERCYNLLHHVLALHMAEMYDDGFFELAYQDQIESQAYQNCEDGAGASSQDTGAQRLTIDSIGGLFLLHTCISVICLLCAAYDRRWSLWRWGPAPGHEKMTVDEIKAVKKTGRIRKVFDKGLERQQTFRQELTRSASGRFIRSRVNSSRADSIDQRGMSTDEPQLRRDESMSSDFGNFSSPVKGRDTPQTRHGHDTSVQAHNSAMADNLQRGETSQRGKSKPNHYHNFGNGEKSPPLPAPRMPPRPKPSLSDKSTIVDSMVDPGEAFAQLEQLLRMKDGILMAFAASEAASRNGGKGAEKGAEEGYDEVLHKSLDSVASEASLHPPAEADPHLVEKEENGADHNGTASNGAASKLNGVNCGSPEPSGTDVYAHNGHPVGVVSVSDFV